MKTVENLSTNESIQYSDNTPDMVAVCQSYCTHNNLSTWFYSMLHDGLRFIDSLPIVEGDKTISCGDYCIIKTN